MFFLSAVFEFEVLFPKFVPPSELVSDSFVFNIANNPELMISSIVPAVMFNNVALKSS